jgi:hypothetical protein
MSFASPAWLAVAAAIAAGVVIAHLFSTNLPPQQVLPTVRFIPPRAPMAVLRTRRITDLALLLLRLLAIALLGMALAGAHWPIKGPPRVVVLDVSRSVATGGGDLADLAGAGDIVVFDSTARAVDRSVLDTVKPGGARGSLSAGLVAAHRAIGRVTTARDRIELLIVSPVVREEVDSATAKLIALWEGPVRVVRVPVAATPASGAFEIRAAADDPVIAALAFLRAPAGPVRVRIVRDQVTATDSAWARAGNLLVTWPSADSVTSEGSASAVSTASHTVVGVTKPDRVPSPGRLITRWSDGSAAATEQPLGAGCIRDVAIPVDAVGDVSLRDSFRGIARSFLEPCGGARDFAPVPDSLLLPRARPQAAGIIVAPGSRLPVILALLALVALGVEQLLRRTRKQA